MAFDLSGFVADQVEIYKQNTDHFDALRQVITAALAAGVGHLSGVLPVEGRVKTVSSYAEKCLRRRKTFSQPAWQLTDLCGVRVITTSKDAMKPVREFIEASFEIDENEDTSLRLGEMEFGYQSVHYTVSLSREKEGVYQAAQMDIPEALYQRRDSAEAEKTGLPIGPVFKAEIQVRTLLQHAWAVMIHDNLYKTEIKKKPRNLVRESGRMAALLEDTDEAFLKLLNGIHTYTSYYGAYMSPTEIRDEIAVQQAILSQDRENKSIALKIARLADNLNDRRLTRDVESVLADFEARADADIHRELGMVRWKLGNENGRENLARATELAPDNPDNWCELGRTFFRERDYWKAMEAYEQAFRIAPRYPRALLRYIECRILERTDFGFIPLIRHNLEKAIAVSDQQVAAGMNIPWAWYEIGFFQLLLGRPARSLDAYGKAILSTADHPMVDAVYRSLTEIHKKAVGLEPTLAEHLNWVRSFLKVVLAGRFGQAAHALPCAVEPRLDGSKSLSICAEGGARTPFSADETIIIVAGDCRTWTEKMVSDYEPMIQFAFDGFRGTVCSGGTRAGIAGVVGDLPDPDSTIRKVAYLPSGHPAEDGEHPAYEPFRTTEGTYSPLDPIMLWSDILAAGVDPETVRLLGIGGGPISAFEYRLALLLNAGVGVLSASGGAALEIATDSNWAHAAAGSDTGRALLLRLPNDQETLRVFIQPPRGSGLISPEKRQKMAVAAHAGYRAMCLPGVIEKRKELAPWESLDETFKGANFSQIDHIEDKLKRLGLTLCEMPPGAPPALFEFDDDQVALLAEMEHGRWVVDRLLNGWTFGEERDNEKKTRPQLIPWSELPEGEKEKDRKPIKEIPRQLASVGYRIVDPEKP